MASSSFTSFRDMMTETTREDEPEAEDLWREWDARVERHFENAIFSATGVNEHNQKVVCYLEPRATHPLDMMYVHSGLGDVPQSVRERNDLPLMALMATDFATAVVPESLEAELGEVLAKEDPNYLNELQWLRTIMGFVAKRMFNYAAEAPAPAARPKRPPPPRQRTPADRASLDYSRFAAIEDDDDDEGDR